MSKTGRKQAEQFKRIVYISLQENKRIEQKSLLVAKINECLQFVLYLLALYDDMQGMVTRVLARLGGKHEAPSQCGEHISCK